MKDVALVAGAALALLDAVVRGQEKWAGAWRQRLALTAAALAAKQTGRVEAEATLRDAVLLMKGATTSALPAVCCWPGANWPPDPCRCF